MSFNFNKFSMGLTPYSHFTCLYTHGGMAAADINYSVKATGIRDDDLK